ncbi:MAG TPA: murein L,D-transpeptidase catalytic domain family protein [Caulobacteraceae bacterium]|nr:murein L,D-transpeptidase catalytic domain family protein [Caulobacteraceae bacterium]
MSDSFRPSRRQIVASSATLGLAAIASPALALSTGSSVVDAAKAGLARVGDRILHQDVVGVADFSPASSQSRLHLVDIAAGRIDSVLVAHGRGSDPAHTGWLSRFSNAPGSDCTSEGAYLTGAEYIGEHGRSMRLIGLDPTNCNAEPRAVVVHSAWYVGPEMIRARGMLGRSDGCFAVGETDLPGVLGRLGPGRLLVAAKL